MDESELFINIGFLFFVFQAEAGIRVLVRSRGRGDGYKGQHRNINIDAVFLVYPGSQITQTPAPHTIKVRNCSGFNNPDQSLALGGV